MINKTKTISLLILQSILFIAIYSTHAHAEFLADGKPSKEPKINVKTLNGFKAQLWLIDDLDFFKRWGKPSKGVILNPINITKKDKEIYAIIIFSNPGANKANLCNISCDMKIINPDGTIYGEAKEQECWINKPPPQKDILGLSVFYLGIIIRNNEQAGTYKIQAIVNDKVKKTMLQLDQTFDVLE